MADLLSNYGLLPYLEELQMEEFSTFKELLKQEIVKRQRRSFHGPELTKGTRHDVVTLLEKHYTEKQAWEMMLMVLLQIDKRNIWEKAKVELRRKLNPYRLHMKEKFHLLWRNETCLPIPDCFYEETIKTEYEELRDAYASEEMGTGPRTVVLRGPEGMGKTTLLRKVMLEWTEGNLWRDVFTFVFFLDGREMNHAGEMSFLEFISKDWPESSQQLESVFCQSQDILFIIDDLEACKFELRLDNETCDDWHQKKHIDVLLGSLLQKKILPDSSLLLALGPGQFTKNYFLLQQPKCIVVRGFSEHQRKSYFSHFFHEHDKAKLAVSFLEEQQCLSPLCQSPLLCWLLCLCVKWQLDRGEDLEMTYQTTTSLFVSFFINTVKTGVENLPVKANMDQVIALCSLATRGIWTQTYLFRQEEFRQLGISQSSVSTWIGINLLQRHGSYIAFIHKQVQEFYATLFYYLELPKDFPSKSFDNLLKFTITNLCNPESTLPQMRLFLVGLMTEKINRLLDTRLDLKLAEETKKTVMDNLKIINLMNKSKMDFLELFHILFETREQEFVMKVMAFITEASIHIGSTRALMVASYCLAQSRSLRYLNLYIENVFSDDSKFFSMNRKLGLWEKLCSVLITNKDLQVLELNKCSLSDASLDVLCKVMAQSFCKVKTVVLRFLSGFGDGVDFFKAICYNSDLKYLNLHGTSLSRTAVRELCETLKHPKCFIEKLLLGNCGIVSEACDDIAPVLMCNKKLSHLSFLQNCLKDDGVRVLCDALKHPNCVLTILVLNNCNLSSVACDYLCEVLLCNQFLSILDLGSNVLEQGVSALCNALKDPECALKELWLMGCYLTSDCCKDIAAVIKTSQNLKTLKIGHNELLDVGVKWLCDALKYDRCILENLGLEMCGLTSACSKDLASALTTSKTLYILNLDGITLDVDGMSVLCDALVHPDCELETLGLDQAAYDEECQMLLKRMKDRNPDITITKHTWSFDESRITGTMYS